MSSAASELWVPAAPGGRRERRAVLFCLPHAGAGAAAFRGWARALAPDVETLPIRLPGREGRFAEPPVIDPRAVAGAVASAIEVRGVVPYAIYGHSMGAWIAFEVVRELRRLGVPLPIRLYVGAARPPDSALTGPFDGLSLVTDAQLAERLIELGSTPPEVFAEPELGDLMLAVLRADFGWLDNYQYQPQSRLPVPVVAFAGSADQAAPAIEMAGWERHTSAGLRLHELAGGHLFLQDQHDQLIALIRADLIADSARAAGHCVPLGGTGWDVWREAVLRMTGFPADGLMLFTSQETAAVADACLDGADRETFEKVLAAHWQLCIARAAAIAGQPRFLEAVTWQNPAALSALDGLRRPSTSAKKSRERARAVAKYWQRYCGKNETIGFFGPSAWARLDPAAPPVILTHGRDPLRSRQVYLEHWALQALGSQLAADPAIRRWLPVTLAPQITFSGGRLLRPAQPPVTPRPAEAAALRSCDGRQAARVVADLVPAAARNPADGYLILDRLAEQGVVVWGTSLPQRPDAERVLREQIAAIADDDARARAAAVLDRLADARDAVAAAAGDPAGLRAALAGLDAEFTDITGAPPRRRPGEMYAGRALCYEDAVADVDVVFGGAVLDALAAPLGVLLPAARWLTTALAEAYGSALRTLFTELADGGGQARLADLWYLAQGLLFGSGQRPVDAVAAEFVARWSTLFGLDRVPPATARLSFASADLVGPAARAFPANRPGFAAGRLHSPDVHICATDADALRNGEFFLVLGELHAAWPTFDAAVFTTAHPEPGRLRDALAADLGSHRIRPLYPEDWPRFTGRIAHTLDHPTDRQLGFTLAPGADLRRLLPVTAVTVAQRDGDLLATAPDGRSWPLIEVFAALVSMHAVDAFKLVTATAHTPRITIDRLVVVRETWRATVGETGLADARGEPARYLAGRRLRRDAGLPERVFVKLGTETKPVFADLTSAVYVSSLCSMMRRAREQGGDEVPVTFTELLPGPEHAWLTDAAGHRYFSELRLQARDPEPGGPP